MRQKHSRAESDNSMTKPQSPRHLGVADAGLPLLAWVLGMVSLWQLVGIPPPSGYELSIYDSLPPLFLYAFQASLALHIFVAARACFRRERVANLAAISGIAGTTFTVVVALSLPQLRGYLTLIGDFSSHVANSTEMASTWNIDKEIFYPALYSLVQVVRAVTGLDASTIWSFGSVVWYVLYVLLCIMVAGSLLADSRAALFAGLAAAIPVAGAFLRSMFPASVSVQLVPLLLYVYTKSKRMEGQGFNVLLILLLILLPFLHPLTSLMAVLWLALLELARWTLSKFPSWRRSVGSSRIGPGLNPVPLSFTATLILAITWIAWLSSFALWYNNIRGVANWLSGEAHTQLASIDYLASRSGFSILEVAELISKRESGVILYTGLALVSLPLHIYVVKRQIVGERLVQYLVPLHALLALSILAAGFAIVGPLGGFDLYRFARFLVPWAVLVLASVPLLVDLVGSLARFALAAFVVFILIVVALGGFWALHPSPFLFQPNDQMTVQETDCVRWIYGSGDGRALRGIWSLRRQAEIALGPSTASSIPSIRAVLPDHFGYDGASSLGEVFAEPIYLLISEYDRATVLDLWASADKYTEEDFRRLETDRSVTLVYANGGCDIWAVELGMEDHTQ